MSDRFARVREIVLAARDLPAERRAAWIENECGSDAELRAEVESLLAHDSPEEARLQTGGAVPAGLGPGRPAVARDRFGSYEVLDRLDARGDAAVYRARRVGAPGEHFAVRVFAPTASSGPAPALEPWLRLRHPNLAPPVDAGLTEDGRLWVARQFVRGAPLSDYADQVHLPIRDRVELALLVVRAMEFAHDQCVVHGRLRPSNVLVARQEGRAVPRILDFHFAAPAPGGASGPGPAPPARADDIRAVVALLRELLTGEPPAPPDPASAATVAPPSPAGPALPSGCLETPDAPRRARCRRTTLPAWRRELEGELDAIVRRGLASDPERGYARMGELAEDLDRYLAGHPGPGSDRLASVWRRFLRRFGGPRRR